MPLPLPKAPPLTIRDTIRNPFSSFFHSLLFCFEVMRRHAWFVERLIQMVEPILLETDGGASLGPPLCPLLRCSQQGIPVNLRHLPIGPELLRRDYWHRTVPSIKNPRKHSPVPMWLAWRASPVPREGVARGEASSLALS